MKKLIFLSLLLTWGLLSQAQAIYNNGARIVSTTGSYWVVDNDDFSLVSTSPTDLAQMANLTITNDASLTLGTPSTPSYLTVSGTLTNNSGTDGLAINNGSSLIESSGVSATVNVELSNAQWHLISSPVESATSIMFLNDYLQYFDEPTGLYVDIVATDSVLNPAQGFSFYSIDGSTAYNFTGALNAGPKSRAISHSNVSNDDNDGANLLGNPYPSYIDWDEVDDSYGAVYYWKGTAFLAYPATGTFGLGSRYIPPMQGFFIVMGSAGTFNLENADRTHATASFYKSGDEAEDFQGLLLYADNGTTEDQTYLRFDVESAENFEQVRDAWKLPSSTPGLAQIWSQSTSGNLSIDVRPETEVVQLGFANDQNGNYSIGTKSASGFSQMFLEDTQLNYFHNLELGAYHFDWATTDSQNRFKLHLQATGTSDLEAQAAQVYAANNRVYVRINEPGIYTELAIFDLSGRLITEKPLSSIGLQSFELNEPFGMYLVKLIGDQGYLTEKVVVK